MKAKARILLVEDESITADSIEQMLRLSGYEVTSIVDSGEAAIQIVGEDPPDVVLMDVKLAGKMDGIEAAKQIRASRDIPAIYLTAHSNENLIDRAKITEPFGYLLKPIDERELWATIEMTLYKHKLEMELKETNRRLKQEIVERERAEEELKQYRDHLEELVEERTAELIETNKQLQHEITERKRTEETLRESEERFRMLVENQGEGVGIVDLEEQFTFANPAADRIFGVPLGSLVGRNLREFLEPEQFARIRQQTEKRKRGEVSTYETELVRPAGEKRHLLVTVTPQFDNAHRYIGALGIFRDITERKQAEEELRLHSEIINNMLEGVNLVRASDGVIVYTNPIFEKLFGYGPGEMIGKHISVVNAPMGKGAEETAKEIMDSLIKNGTWQGDVHNIKKDGTVFWCYASVSWFEHPDYGKVLISVQEDVTKRKQAEEQILVSNARLQYLLSSTSAVIYTAKTSDDYGATFISENVTQMVGYEPWEFLEKSSFWIDHVHPEDVQRILDELPRIFEQECYAYEYRFRRKDDTYIWMRDEMKLIRDEEGKPLEIVGYWADITERKRAEEVLKASYEQLRNLPAHLQAAREEERTTIAREIHDELGQALVALKMDLSWLKRRLTNDQTKLLEKAYAMEALIDSIIQVVKKIVTELRPGLLDDLGLSAAIEWQAEEFQQRTGILCDVLIDPEDIILKDDVSTAVFRIFQETLTNVARHAHAIQVHVLLRETEDSLLLEVRDNGEGITAKQLSDPKSFGLIGIRERVQFLGGQVTFQGIPNKGTTVTVSIPLNNS